MATSTSVSVSEGRPAASSRVWRRAAALGSLWAAFEIVVGSFLHNLRVPFTGTVLASLGVFLMCAGVQVWRDRGLVWRAALICALMKSVSPSAVILNPMIGIFAEGLLLQAAVSVLGAGALGCAVGGAAAVSLTLVQKIISLVIVYGADIVRLYEALVRYAARVTGWESLDPASPILLLLAVQGVLGASAGLAGRRLGKGFRPGSYRPPAELTAAAPGRQPVEALGGPQPSLLALGLAVAALPAGLYWISVQPLAVSAPGIAVAVGLAVWRYGGRLRRLRRPRLWIELGVVLLLSGLVLGALEGNAVAGIRAGAQMILRAVYVIVMFSAISVELKHPRISARLHRGRFASAGAALQAAFAALPDFMSAIPGLRAALKNPARVLAGLFDRVEYWQNRVTASPVVILTGEKGEGKTTLCAELVELVRARGGRVAGVLSPGFWDDGVRSGYQVEDLLTGRRKWLARRSEGPCDIRQGPYGFDVGALRFGRQALAAAAGAAPDLIIVDEVGPLELRGDGWGPELDTLQGQQPCAMLWVVRPTLVDEVRRRWPVLEGAPVVHVRQVTALALAAMLFGDEAFSGAADGLRRRP